MKFPKTLLRFSTSSTSIAEQSPFRPISILVVNFSSSNSGQFASKRPQYDDESRAIRVSVWWDFENCHLPSGSNVYKVSQIITSAVRNSGIKGPITITAFGDVLQLSRTNQEALSATGINLTHVPQGGKNSADRSLLMELISWVSQNPPPAHLFLISSDRDFASVLHKLRMSNYNILLAGKESTPGVLCSAASIMWDWNSLVKGENFTGKYFNQPPDGPYNSWYGHYKTPLRNPFATSKPSSNVKTEELRESKSNSDSSKVCCVPKEVVKQIRLILSSYPKGISITELQEELSKSKILADKDFYGHKSFLRFLLSMPKIVQVNQAGDGLFFVHAVTQETPKPLESSTFLSATSKMDNTSSPKIVNDHEVANVAVEARGDDTLGKMHQDVKENDQESRLQESSQESIVVNQQDVTANNKNPIKENQLALVIDDGHGFFKKLKRLLFGSPDMDVEHLQEGTVMNKNLKSTSEGADETPSTSAKEVKGETEVGNNQSASERLIFRVLKRFKFWGRNTELSNAVTSTQELIDLNDIFTRDSFWIDVESFINTPRGYTVVSHSRTREAMAKNLQSEGPSSLKSLDDSQMLKLVSLLISEKNWIQEISSNELPFRVSCSSNKQFGLSNTNAANGLRSLFVNISKSQWDEQDSDQNSKNVSKTSLEQKSVERTRREVFADCQKLIKKITEEHPEGYNLGLFRRDFLEAYGYHLDIKKLGYDRLQSLLQLMPGVKVEFGYILPLTSSSDQSYSSFEELGPVFDTKQTENTNGYEAPVSEDEDSDVETSEEGYEMKKKKQEQNKNGDDDATGTNSYLLQILDSWDNCSDGKQVKSVGRKQKGVKSYSFVADSEERCNEDKLVDGILGSLKKSSEIRVER